MVLLRFLTNILAKGRFCRLSSFLFGTHSITGLRIKLLDSLPVFRVYILQGESGVGRRDQIYRVRGGASPQSPARMQSRLPQMLNPTIRTVLSYEYTMTIVLNRKLKLILLSHMNEWIIELERVVGTYEAAVDEIEELIDQLEQDPGDEDDWLIRTRQERQRRQQLENALETVEHLAQLAHAANAILNDALDTATLGLELIVPPEAGSVGAGEDADAGRGPSWSPMVDSVRAGRDAL